MPRVSDWVCVCVYDLERGKEMSTSSFDLEWPWKHYALSSNKILRNQKVVNAVYESKVRLCEGTCFGDEIQVGCGKSINECENQYWHQV